MSNPDSNYPNDPDAESGFLGSVMSSDGNALEEFPVTLNHFFSSANRTIAEACLSLFDKKLPVNNVTVSEALRKSNQLAHVGGPVAVAEIMMPPRMAGYYHAALCDRMARRNVVDAARWALNEWSNMDTADNLLEAFQRRLSGIEISASEKNEVPVAAEAIYRRLDKLDRGEEVVGLKTGNAAWNKAFGGLVPGAYYALAGRPGTGKSAMMEEMIADLIANDLPALVFQRDMSPQKMVERLCCRWCGVPYWRYVRGMVNQAERDRIRETVKGLTETPLYLYNPVGLTAEKLCAIMRREKRIHGIKAVFLDHIQALKVGKDLREGLTQASLAIRGCVTEIDLPFVTLCHLNREGGKGSRPSASNIKEFDQLFGDVDGMAILWREEMQDDYQAGDKTIVNFLVAKNRDGAETEEQIIFNGAMLSFEGLAVKEHQRC